MTKHEKHLLLKQAAKLTTLGVTVERERGKLKKLVEQDVLYTDPRMLAALERFQQADFEWKRLESEHLELRENLKK